MYIDAVLTSMYPIDFRYYTEKMLKQEFKVQLQALDDP